MPSLGSTRRSPPIAAAVLVASSISVGYTYSRYVDWPALDGRRAAQSYIPAMCPVSDAYRHTYHNFMDTWELYRFASTSDAMRHLADPLALGSPSVVHVFPLIIPRPPPYWWHPEPLPTAQLYRSQESAPDGQLYSEDSGITYLATFDG